MVGTGVSETTGSKVNAEEAGGRASIVVMRRYLKQTEADVEAAIKKFSPVGNLSR